MSRKHGAGCGCNGCLITMVAVILLLNIFVLLMNTWLIQVETIEIVHTKKISEQ